MVKIKCSEKVSGEPLAIFEYLTYPNNYSDLLRDFIRVEWTSHDYDWISQSLAEFKMTRFGLTQNVQIKVLKRKVPDLFIYKQTQGLFKSWRHEIQFKTVRGGVIVTDLVEFELQYGLLGKLAEDLWLKKDITKILESRLRRVGLTI